VGAVCVRASALHVMEVTTIALNPRTLQPWLQRYNQSIEEA